MLKLISLNLERSKHLDRSIPFFREEQPDVLCLQEVFELDLETIQRETGLLHLLWFKDTLTDDTGSHSRREGYSGNAILSRTPFLSTGSEYYYIPKTGISLEFADGKTRRETNAQGVVWASLEREGEQFVIANTHFTWTPDGFPNEFQERDFPVIKELLQKLPPHILVGDLNAPRGSGMWEKFQALYVADNIPSSVVTTLDQELHKTEGLSYVVDALFSGPGYRAENVRIVSGVSDHHAIVAEIGRM